MTNLDGLRNLRCDESETAAIFISGDTLRFQKPGRAERGAVQDSGLDFRKIFFRGEHFAKRSLRIVVFFGRVFT